MAAVPPPHLPTPGICLPEPCLLFPREWVLWMAGRMLPGPFWVMRPRLPRDQKETLRQLETLEVQEAQPGLSFELHGYHLRADH